MVAEMEGDKDSGSGPNRRSYSEFDEERESGNSGVDPRAVGTSDASTGGTAGLLGGVASLQGEERKATGLGEFDPSPPHHVRGWLDVVTEHVNNHLRAYRMGAWVVGSVGVVLLIRLSRVPLKRFRQVSDIPTEYILTNRTISGVVVATKWNSMGVWHVPGWKRILRYDTVPPKKVSGEELLPVMFSGVSFVDQAACIWLKQNLLGKRVWLKLLDHTSPAALDRKAIECAVYIKQKGLLRWRKSCVNESLLAAGIGAVSDVSGFANNAKRAEFLSRLIRSEKGAKTRGKGVWLGTEHVTMFNRIRNYFKRS